MDQEADLREVGGARHKYDQNKMYKILNELIEICINVKNNCIIIFADL